MTSPILTVDELAARLKVPKKQVYKLTREGKLPVVKVGRHNRYRLDAIERWELGGGSKEAA